MKCPHCAGDIPGEICPVCKGELPAASKYCCWCGESLADTGKSAAMEGDMAAGGDEDSIDFSKRLLCSDGSCIGVIGPDGRCKECGKPYSGEP
jgi:hypothetical protein